MPIRTHSYSISIKNACQQQWSGMSDKKGGKFCEQCQKTVVDFTQLTDQEIIQLINAKKENLCARILPEQMNRNLEIQQPGNKWASSVLAIGLLASGVTGNTYAAIPFVHSAKINLSGIDKEFSNKPVLEIDPNLMDSSKYSIRGKVVDSATKEPIAFASVYLKNTNRACLTNKDGMFTLVIPEDNLERLNYLEVSYVGFTSFEKKIHRRDLPAKIDLIMLSADENAMLGEVIVVPKRKKWWQFWK